MIANAWFLLMWSYHITWTEKFLQSIAWSIRSNTMLMITKLEKCRWLLSHCTLSSAQKRKPFRESSRTRTRGCQRWSHDDCQCLISADVIVSQNLKWKILQSIAWRIRGNTMVMITKLENCLSCLVTVDCQVLKKEKNPRKLASANARYQRWSHDDC